MLTPYPESEAVDERRKLIYSCIVLHNMLLAVNDSCAVNGEDPQRAEVQVRDDDGGLSVAEQPFSHRLGKTKRDDLADIFHVVD
ncbi:unnamed protein product [Phytophthora lilii]|uniref:Unnamed protein product n=1 Tax=Phytophthora lilii TaxID=2077276 RepID=A0A9W6TGG2_9STRA|nr:unnamed protein product [Phytophthora lilii]